MPAKESPKRCADLLAEVVEVDRRRLAAGRRRRSRVCAEDRQAGDRQQRLGNRIGQRPQPRAEPGGEHQGPQPRLLRPAAACSEPAPRAHRAALTISGSASRRLGVSRGSPRRAAGRSAARPWRGRSRSAWPRTSARSPSNSAKSPIGVWSSARSRRRAATPRASSGSGARPRSRGSRAAPARWSALVDRESRARRAP